ncbi:hypothetical protein Tco_0290662 [Tanacetum coccineum]
MLSFPSPEPTVSCLNDLDFFKDFENEFPAIIYNDVLTSKSDLSTKPTLCPQHIDEFDLKYETSLSEYDEEEQNVLYFNDLFPFNIIYPDDLKLDKDNHDNKIDIIQSSGDLMAAGLGTRMLMEHRDAQGQSMFGEVILDLDTPRAIQFQLGRVRRRMSWREFILALGLHSAEEMHNASFSLYWTESTRRIPDKGDLREASGLTVICPWHFPFIDMAELVRLQLCIELDNTWAWVPAGPARQEGGVGGVAEEAPMAPRGGDEDEEMPHAVPPPPRTQGERIARLEEEMHDMREALEGQREVLDSMARDFSKFSTWTVTSLGRLMERAGVPYTGYLESSVEYQRRTRQRTDKPSTSTAQQPDP